MTPSCGSAGGKEFIEGGGSTEDDGSAAFCGLLCHDAGVSRESAAS